MSRRARRPRFHRREAERRAQSHHGLVFDPWEAAKALREQALGPDAVAMGTVGYFLHKQVGDGAPLRDRPGTYEHEGVALFHGEKGWIFALRPTAFVGSLRAELSRRHTRPDAAPTAAQLTALVSPHPWFLGRVVPPGAVTEGWIGVLVARDATGGVDA